jgi:recombination protein RecR
MAVNQIESLIFFLAKLPGLGPRSARRALLHMLKYKDTYMLPLAEAIKTTAQTIATCVECGNMDVSNPCHICADKNRDHSVICVVETVADLWAIERSNIFKGYYHVLGGSLSMHDEHDPISLNMEKLLKKVQKKDKVSEVIIATNATIEGQTTAYYITELLKDEKVKISRLAHGIPMGGELDYLDDATLLAALNARQPF